MQHTPSDYAIFEAIEAIREKRKKQKNIVSLVDYGAGDPESNRSQDEMYQGVQKQTTIAQLSSIGLKGEWAQKVYDLVKVNKPKTILELGTCCGFSAMYMAKGYPEALVHTIEGDSNVAQLAEENIQEAKCTNIRQHIGRFQDVLPLLLSEIKTIDLAFVDGHHDKEATLRYTELLKPYLSPKAVVIFDDISWSSGMKEAWMQICEDAFFKQSIDLKKLGVCLREEAIYDLV